MTIARPPTIYVDPGVQYAGWCLGKNGVLEAAGKIDRAEFRTAVAWLAKRCIVEQPWGVGELCKERGIKGSTLKDILELTLAAGEYGGRFAEAVYLHPYMAPKPIRHERALEALDRHELSRLPPQKTFRIHTLCAVYMFLRDVGRIVA
jgi:hypothetical protein